MPTLSSSARFLCVLAVFQLCASLFAAGSRAQLSQNSGINSSDTWVTMDLTVTTSGTTTLPQAVYNPATGTSSSTLNIAPPTQNFHVESGYDATGALVMNLTPTGAPVNPSSTDAPAIGFIRFGGGQVTVFGQDGTPLYIVPPSGVSNVTWPSALFGSNPGPSVVQHLVVANVPNYANGIHAEYTSDSQHYYVTPTMPSGGTATWTYVLSGSSWLAQSFVMTAPTSGGSTTRSVQFANIRWYDNTANDAARTSKGYTATPPAAATTSAPATLSSSSTPNASTGVYNLGGSQNIVFQHGILSDANTWNRMRPWLNQDFRFGTEIVMNFGKLGSLQTLSSQGTGLFNEINSVGGSNYILVGHSQGGLISRYAAQSYQQANPKQITVAGVVTLDTPHQGAPLALTPAVAASDGLQALATNLYNSTGCLTAYDNLVCFFASLAYTGAPDLAEYGLQQGAPAIVDLTPGSAFLTQLNAFSESFRQAAVVSNTPMRFNEARLLDNAIFLPAGCYPETGCGERAFATAVNITYDVVEAYFIFSLFEEIFDPDNSDYWAAVADYFFQILVYMDAVDIFWNGIASGFSSSDAIVPSSSQNYPYSSALQYPINGADSHTGATTSTYAHTALYNVLANFPFSVPTQASCSYAASPASYSISGNGGAGNFSLATGAGCQWSAVSQSPWITISSGSSGTSGGSISFTVAVNPQSIPRTGTITIGSGAASTTFSVQQAGFCGYTLSANAISIPSGGGSATISVSTGTGCVWSAASNGTWLTISNGSGTGPGSFTVSAPANAGSTDLLAIVTVMSQTLTVIEGNPVGTPGTGTVTITGAPNFAVICTPGCSPSCSDVCTQYITESGTIWVNIGGDIFSVAYSGSIKQQGLSILATNLANAINAGPSLVTASVSGPTITVTSKVKGALTNYGLSTWYAYDTRYFSTPAFTATLSAPTMTGGTD